MSIDLDDPIALLLAASAALDQAHVPAAAYGGLTLGMYGEARETRDADLAVANLDVEVARDALERLDVTVVIAFADVTFGDCKLSRLSLVGGGQLNTVDLVAPRSSRYASAVLARTLNGTLRGQHLRVVSPEDFVLLKILATRDRDLDDARSVVATQRGRLDEGILRDEVDQLAGEIVDHDVRGRFDAVMK